MSDHAMGTLETPRFREVAVYHLIVRWLVLGYCFVFLFFSFSVRLDVFVFPLIAILIRTKFPDSLPTTNPEIVRQWHSRHSFLPREEMFMSLRC